MMPFQWPGAWFPEFSCETHVLSPVITRVHKLVISSEVHFLYPRLFLTIFMKKDPWNFKNKKCANCQEMFVLLNLFINFNFCFESFSDKWGMTRTFSIMNTWLSSIKQDTLSSSRSYTHNIMTMHFHYLSINFDRLIFFQFKKHITPPISHFAGFFILSHISKTHKNTQHPQCLAARPRLS